MQERPLAGKVAVVTGASSGVGRAVARELAARGAKVGLVARSAEALQAAAREIEELGSEALVLPLDVSDSEAVDAAADQVVANWKRLDIWVNDAMVSVFAPISQITPHEFRRVTEVNYLGFVHGTLAALRHMRPVNSGVLIQIGSALAYRSIPLQSAYCASKAAIRGFTDSLRSELIHEGSRIRVCMVQLPAVNTPQFEVVRNRLGGHPQPVPPIYQPEVIAREVARCVSKPRREVWIGWSTVRALLLQRFVPGLLDWFAAKKAWEAQTTRQLPPGHPLEHQRDNVDEPLAGDRGAHGPFDARSREYSVQPWLRRNIAPLALMTFGMALGVRLLRGST